MDEGIEVQQVMDAIEDIYSDESVSRGERKERLVSMKDEIDILLDCIDRDEKREEEVS